MPNADATPTEAAPHSPPYLVISFRGYDEQSANWYTAEPSLVIQRATTADAAIAHIVTLDRQLRDDRRSRGEDQRWGWTHIAIDQTLRSVGDDDNYLGDHFLGCVDDFADGYTAIGYSGRTNIIPDSWRERVIAQTAALDAAAAAAEAEAARVRLAAEAIKRQQQEAAEHARAQAAAVAAAEAAEARDRAEFARLLAKYGKDT